MIWTGPRLTDFDAMLEETTMAATGDVIRYRPSGGAWSDMTAIVHHSDQDIPLGQGEAIAQDMTVEILSSQVPAKPSSQCRIELPKRPGKVFRPVNVKSDDSGNCWIFELEAVGA